MPGSKPGERRGGRQKGTQNRANFEKNAAMELALSLAFAKFDHEYIDSLTPAQFQLIAMHEAIKAGFFHSALTIADKVSPYYDARLAPLIVEPPAEPEEAKAKRLHRCHAADAWDDRRQQREVRMKLRVVLLAAAAFAWLVFAATVPLWITNPVRAQSQPATVFLNPTTVGVTQITASATGTTLATTATLAAATTQRTWICGLEIIANATGAATGNATVTGVIGGTMNFTQFTAPLASGVGTVYRDFSPCLPSSAVNTAIAVVSAAPGSGGTVSVTVGRLGTFFDG